MTLWTAAEAQAATGGRLTTPQAATGGRPTAAWAATGVSIDSRSLRPGDLFVALTQARDGHDFVAEALARGAAAALVARIPEGVPATAPLLIVPDVPAALADLARAARARTGARVVGITGSAGKTSTKEMLRAILAPQGATHASEASHNNQWGVPLTLARMPADTRFAVIEIGMNRPGEIAPLARLADLDVAVITTVAAAHLEAFDSIEGIAHEKAAILDGLRPGGTAILNADVATAAILHRKARSVGARILRFGTAPELDWCLTEARVIHDTTVARATRHGEPLLFKVATPGRHFALNALAALAAAEALGADLMIAACDLGAWQPPSGRGRRERVTLDPVEETFFDLIDDAFNANPASVAAALDVLIGASPTDGIGRVGGGRRIAILGDMLELGPTERALHEAIAQHPGLEAVHLIHCVGPRMQALHDALSRRQRGEWAATAEELAARVRSLVDAGDILLVKGSKGSKVSLVVDALRRIGQGNPAT